MSRLTQVPSLSSVRFRLRGCHPLRPGFPAGSANLASSRCRRSFNPGPAVTGPVWAAARSLATTCAITVVFFSSGYLDVSVPRVRPWLGQVPGSRPAGCPIRKSAHQRVFAPTRGLSQLVTSFVASESLGILHARFSPFLVLYFAGSHSQDTAVARASFSCPPFARMGAAGVKSLFLFCVALEFCSLPPIFL